MKIIEDYKLNKDRMEEVSPKLLAQAVRVYRANQRQGTSGTKTRSQVAGTNKKMYKQKGTGHARHSDAKAPIFVGGGVAHGPKRRNCSLELSQKMKQLAVKGALFLKNKEKKVITVSGLAKLSGKTKELAVFLQRIRARGERASALIVTNKILKNVYQAARNIQNVKVFPVTDLNVLEIMKAKMILWDEEIDIEGKEKKAKSKKA
jgi:large subunit ribosomal protein L4